MIEACQTLASLDQKQTSFTQLAGILSTNFHIWYVHLINMFNGQLKNYGTVEEVLERQALNVYTSVYSVLD